MDLYPINLDIKERLCLVVGGGTVALRKCYGLLQAGAQVRVISPEVVAEIQKLADEKEVEWFDRPFAEGDLEEAFMVFAATDKDDVQHAIAQEASERGVLLNSADGPVVSDFHVPAHFRRGAMLVTVSTGGGSPALARKLRLKLEGVIGPEYEPVVELMGLVREGVIHHSGDSQESGDIFRRLIEGNLLQAVLEKNWFDVQMLLLQELPAEMDSAALLKTFLEKQDSDGR